MTSTCPSNELRVVLDTKTQRTAYIYIGGSNENIDDSLFLGSFVAVTTDTMSDDTVWFIKVEQDLDGRSELSIETMAELFQQAFKSSVVNF